MRRFIFIAMAAAALGGCARFQKPSAPLALKLAVNDIYCKDTACSCVHYIAARAYGDTVEALKAENVELQIDYFEEPYDLEDALLSGDYDGAICKPWTALKLERRAGADFARVADILDPNGNRWLSGVVVVPADSKFQKLEDLDGARVAIGDADGYEKHYAAKRLFEQRGVTFARVESSASCMENLGLLMDGQVDAAVISDYALTADCAVDITTPEEFRTLAVTEMIPLTSVIVNRKKVSEADLERLQKALFAVSGAAAPESMLSEGFIAPAYWAPAEAEK